MIRGWRLASTAPGPDSGRSDRRHGKPRSGSVRGDSGDTGSELGADLFDSQVRLGSQLSYVDALDAVLPVLTGPGRSAGREEYGIPSHCEAAGLTARDSEVLQCLTEGLSNKNAAESPKTVMHHATHIPKLGSIAAPKLRWPALQHAVSLSCYWEQVRWHWRREYR